jgi:DNA polymerase III epsilon subunit family exonuclease
MSVPRRTVVDVTETQGSPAATSAADALLRDLDFTVVDVETTGWSPDVAGITEIGAVRVRRGEVVAEFTSLVNPGTPVPAPITELTGISDPMLALAPPVAAVLPGLLAFAEGSVLTAHNAPFDLRFLVAACAAAGLGWPGFEVLDTVRLARYLMAAPDEVPDRKLATLAEYFGTPVRPSHRALDDARATAVVLRELLARLADREGVHTLGELTAWLAARDAEAAARFGRPWRLARALRVLRGLRAHVRRRIGPRGRSGLLPGTACESDAGVPVRAGPFPRAGADAPVPCRSGTVRVELGAGEVQGALRCRAQVVLGCRPAQALECREEV